MGRKLLGVVLLIFSLVVAVIFVGTGSTSEVSNVIQEVLNLHSIRTQDFTMDIPAESPSSAPRSESWSEVMIQGRSARVSERWAWEKNVTLSVPPVALNPGRSAPARRLPPKRPPIYIDKDIKMYQAINPGKKMPRVLMYTWCTEDTYNLFMNEVYWKSCYAHAHNFDVVFTDKKNFTGVAKYHGDDEEEEKLGSWYSEENMWALWDDIRHYLFSGKYDYVFMMGADVLILEEWLDWPVWAWDTGHEITVMDQHHFPYWYSYGLNENNVLFKNSQFNKDFIDWIWEYRKGFHLQGDNGPYMETILNFLGRQAEKEGRVGYNRECYVHLKLDKPSVLNFREAWWPKMNDAFEECFFRETDRMVGRFGYRKTTEFGFYPNFIEFPEGKAWFPIDFKNRTAPEIPSRHFQYHSTPLGPWANCWSSVRSWWPTPDENCFAYHWNGPKDPNMMGKIRGTCPDPSFNWKASPYNPDNRQQRRQ